jgi:hypothetical protein
MIERKSNDDATMAPHEEDINAATEMGIEASGGDDFELDFS